MNWQQHIGDSTVLEITVSLIVTAILWTYIVYYLLKGRKTKRHEKNKK